MYKRLKLFEILADRTSPHKSARIGEKDADGLNLFLSFLTDTGENGTNWPVYFRLGAESYSSLGPVGKKEKKIAWDILAKFACGQVSSPRLYRLSDNEPLSKQKSKD